MEKNLKPRLSVLIKVSVFQEEFDRSLSSSWVQAYFQALLYEPFSI